MSTNIIEVAVKFINEKYENSTTEMALTIGEYVFKNMYDSDPEAVASKDPKKKVTFNQLCKHHELGIERSQLSRMVNTHIQEETLIENKVDLGKLTYSHRVELLKIKDTTAKIEMAKRCSDETLSIRSLRDEIAKLKSQHDTSTSSGPVKITSKTMERFEASEAAIEKIDELIAEADVKDLMTVTRNNLYKKAMSLQEHMAKTAANLTKLIADIDAVVEKK
jgi:hypothetical protein